MAKKFNITGNCFYSQHYMADVSRKLAQARKMIDEGEYFIINRPRQYGKTTTLYTLADILNESDEYLAFNISFEGIGDVVFEQEKMFSETFIELLADETPQFKNWLLEQVAQTRSLKDLSEVISQLAGKTHKKMVFSLTKWIKVAIINCLSAF
jgi:energy-coupling factor transporter ATP-binding protein EcfA2